MVVSLFLGIIVHSFGQHYNYNFQPEIDVKLFISNADYEVDGAAKGDVVEGEE